MIGIPQSLRRVARGAQRGFTAMEMMVVMIVAITGMAVSGTWMTMYADGMSNQVAADHARKVADAARRYIKDNYAAVVLAATPTTPWVLGTTDPIGALRTGNYLPDGFSAKNAFGQSYWIGALEPSAGVLQAMVLTTGGEAVSGSNLRRVAQGIGADGGYVISAGSTLMAEGAYKGWELALSNFGSDTAAGRLAVALFFQDGAVVSDYVYRNAVNGRPELNAMTTPLLLEGAGTLQTAGNVCSTVNGVPIARDAGGRLLTCQGGTWQIQGSAFWRDPVVDFASLPTSDAVSTVRITSDTGRAFVRTGTGWQALAVDQNGYMAVPNTLTAGSNKVSLSRSSGDHGTVTLTGADGSNVSLQGTNGTLNVLNNTGNTVASVSQAGGLSANSLSVSNNASLNTLSGRLQITEDAGVVENAACPNGTADNGRIGRNSAGAILSCQSGVWKKQGADQTIPLIFGGIFAADGGCSMGNPLTGNCSCPPGFHPRFMGNYSENPASTQYYCWKYP